VRIVIWSDLSDVGDHSHREVQRLVCWGAALRQMGHEVFSWPFALNWGGEKYRIPAKRPRAEMGIVLASRAATGLPLRWPITVVAQPVGRIVLTDTAWDADFIIGSPNDTLAAYSEFAQPHIERLGMRHIGVHYPPFERVLEMFHRDGTLGDYVRDDLGSIRENYGGPTKRYDIGFRGYTTCDATPGQPNRSQIFAHYYEKPHFEMQFSKDPTWYERPGEYLRFLSECRLTLCLPGDRLKSHRHIEAAMMGSPCVLVRDLLDVHPKHTTENSVIQNDWFDVDGALAGLERCESLVAESDKAYRDGWSTSGQMRTLLDRIAGR
jgi:hypothetical protein